MGAFFLAFFFAGYYLGSHKRDEEKVVVTKENADGMKEFLNWMNYKG